MPPQPNQSPLDTLSWKVNSIDTKTRINEQNIMNERRHVQLINKNLLSLKRELRDKINEISRQKSPEIKKTVDDLGARVSKLEAAVKRLSRKSVKKQETIKQSAFNMNMNKSDADTILNNLIKGAGGKA